MPDFRSDRSDSPEGKGRARRAWDAYAKTVNAVGLPLLEPAIKRYASKVTTDLLGFYVYWHLCGGFEGLVESGMHPSTVWRKVKKFREVFGVHPDEYRFPGVAVKPEKYWESFRKPERAS